MDRPSRRPSLLVLQQPREFALAGQDQGEGQFGGGGHPGESGLGPVRAAGPRSERLSRLTVRPDTYTHAGRKVGSKRAGIPAGDLRRSCEEFPETLYPGLARGAKRGQDKSTGSVATRRRRPTAARRKKARQGSNCRSTTCPALEQAPDVAPRKRRPPGRHRPTNRHDGRFGRNRTNRSPHWRGCATPASRADRGCWGLGLPPSAHAGDAALPVPSGTLLGF
ncbi:hypothetical protein RCH07_003885 [Arthrobacter sp. CG_A4]|nr:hypothetical protein [Arthrobacter sp. CG_A4]